jgi:hypothetical protein
MVYIPVSARKSHELFLKIAREGFDKAVLFSRYSEICAPLLEAAILSGDPKKIEETPYKAACQLAKEHNIPI